jgi:hypothetical protein
MIRFERKDSMRPCAERAAGTALVLADEDQRWSRLLQSWLARICLRFLVTHGPYGPFEDSARISTQIDGRMKDRAVLMLKRRWLNFSGRSS